MEKKIIETGGGRTKVEVHEGGSGEDLLFLHGAGGLLPDLTYWPVRARMRANEVTAIVIRMAKKIRLRFSNRLPAAVSMRFRIQSAAR